MATETKLVTRPAWVAELKRDLARPYTAQEMAQAQKAVHAIRRRNAEKPWPPGTFQRLLDLAHAEDEAEDGKPSVSA
jgi:hypothetical protein